MKKNRAEYTINAQYQLAESVIDESSKGELNESQGGLSGLHPLRSDGSHDSQVGGGTV
jgi:hypothetical protein